MKLTNRIIIAALVFASASLTARAQHHQSTPHHKPSSNKTTASQSSTSPYVGEETHDVKSLSAQEIEGYLQGRGMGFARPAELNSYPGPMHVLELAERLELNAAQRQAAQASFNRMRSAAVRIGKAYVEAEINLNRAFARHTTAENQIRKLVAAAARLQGELRLVHLRAHLEMRRVLNDKQIKRYNELRGYVVSSSSPQPQVRVE